MSKSASSAGAGGGAIHPSAVSRWRNRHGIPSFERTTYLAELTRELVARDMKLRYKRTLLGVAWSLVLPLAQWLVLGFVFRYVLKIEIEHYLSFLFTGILVWNWFQGALAASATCVLDNASLLRRPGFPAPILPFVAVTTHCVHFLFSLPVLLLGATLDGRPFSLGLIALPLVMALQFVLTLGIGYFLSTLHVAYRDTRHLLDVTLMLGFYLTPVVYDGQSVPEPFRPLYQLNPVLHLLEAYRAILVAGRMPALLDLGVLTAFALTAFALGYSRFRRRRYSFADEL